MFIQMGTTKIYTKLYKHIHLALIEDCLEFRQGLYVDAGGHIHFGLKV